MSSTRWKILRWAVVAVILAFLVRTLLRSWNEVDTASLKWNLPGLAGAMAVLLVLQNLYLADWMILLKGMGLSLSWRRAFAVFHQSLVARFVPGNIWHVVGRTYMTTADGLPAALVFGSMAVENALLFGAAVVVFGVTFPFWGGAEHTGALWYLAVIPPIAVVVYPPVLNKLLNFGLAVLRKPAVQLTLSYRAALAAAALHLFARAVGGAALFLIVINVYHIPPSGGLPAVIGIHALSYAVGFASFITPSGLGVREAASAYLLASYMPLPTAVVISLLARLMWTLSEIANAGLGVLIGGLNHKHEATAGEPARLRPPERQSMGSKTFLYELLPKTLNYRLARRGWIQPAQPINLTLSVTNACQSKCKTCGIWTVYKKNEDGQPSRLREEMTVEEFERLFLSMGHVYFVNISGGEPYLRPDLPQIVALADRLLTPGVIHIPTNAISPSRVESMTAEMLETLSRGGRKTALTIKPSFDGVGEMHDFIRGVPGNFEKLEDTLDRLRKLRRSYQNLEVGLGTVISVYNLDQVEQIANFALSQRLDSYISEIAENRSEMFNTGQPITPSADAYEKAVRVFTEVSLKRVGSPREVGRMVQAFRLVYYQVALRTLRERRQTLRCYGGISNAHISPYGDVWPCCILGYEKSFGRLRDYDYDFPRIWRSDRAAQVRRFIAEGKCWCPLANQAYSNILCSPAALATVAWNVLKRRPQR